MNLRFVVYITYLQAGSKPVRGRRRGSRHLPSGNVHRRSTVDLRNSSRRVSSLGKSVDPIIVYAVI